MQTQSYQDGFPMDAQAAINFSYFLSSEEKSEWSQWLQSANAEQQNELVDTLHAIWIENQKQVIPAGFTESKKDSNTQSPISQKNSNKESKVVESTVGNYSNVKYTNDTNKQSSGSSNNAKTISPAAPRSISSVDRTTNNQEDFERNMKQTAGQVASGSAKASNQQKPTSENSSVRKEDSKVTQKNSSQSSARAQIDDNFSTAKIESKQQKQQEIQSRSKKAETFEKRVGSAAQTKANSLANSPRSIPASGNKSKPSRRDNIAAIQKNQKNNRSVLESKKSEESNSIHQSRLPKKPIQKNEDAQNHHRTQMQHISHVNHANNYKNQMQENQVKKHSSQNSSTHNFKLSQAKVVATQKELTSLLNEYSAENERYHKTKLQQEKILSNQQVLAQKSFDALMARSMSILSEFEGVASYIEEMTEKLLAMNEIIKAQAKENTQTRNEVYNKIKDVENGLDRMERNNTANYQDIKDLRGEIRQSIQHISAQQSTTKADSFGIEGLEKRLELLQSKVSGMEQKIVSNSNREGSTNNTESKQQVSTTINSAVEDADLINSSRTQESQEEDGIVSISVPETTPVQHQPSVTQPITSKNTEKDAPVVKSEDQSVIDLRDLL